MNRPRVVHLTTVHHSSDPRIFWKEAVSLRGAEYDVYLVAQHTHAETVEGVQIVPLRPIEGRYRRIVLQREAFVKARKLQAKVYHFHDPELIPVAYALKRSTGARVIYDMHEDYRWHGPVEGRLLRLLERWCFRWVDHVVVVDPQLEALVRQYGGATTLIANYFKPLASEPVAPAAKSCPGGEPFRLLYTGYSARVRGLPMLIRIAEAIAREGLNWHLDLVGRCLVERDRADTEARLQSSPGAQVLSRIGWDTYVPAAAMTPYYRQAHVGLVLWQAHPNHSRIPTKFYEYANHGLPILCSDLPPWRAFIEEHRCGAIVNPNDLTSIMRILKEWAHTPALYAQLSQAALDAASKHQWTVMEGRLLDVYARLLGQV